MVQIIITIDGQSPSDAIMDATACAMHQEILMRFGDRVESTTWIEHQQIERAIQILADAVLGAEQ